MLKTASISQDKEGDTVLKIGKKDHSINYKMSMEDGYVSVTLTKARPKNGYKIAVDVG